MAWGQLQEVAEHTFVDQSSRCVRCLRLCMRIGVPRTSIMDILRKELFQLLNKLLVVHKLTHYALWVRLGDLDKLPTDEHVWTGIITCGGVRRGSGLWGLWRGLSLASLISYLRARPRSWRLGRQDILQLLASRRRQLCRPQPICALVNVFFLHVSKECREGTILCMQCGPSCHKHRQRPCKG